MAKTWWKSSSRFTPKAGNGRRPYPLETMLRGHCMQHWVQPDINSAMEDALYEIASGMRVCQLSTDSALPDRTASPATCWSSVTGPPIVQDHQSLAGRSRRHDTQGTLSMPPSFRGAASTKNKEQQRDRRCIRPEERAISGTLAKAHIGVRPEWPDHSLVTTAANEHDLNQLNLLHGGRTIVSADTRLQGRHSARLAEVDVDWLIARAPGKVRTLKQHPRKEQTAINIRYMKASFGPRWSTISHHPATVRLRESQIQRGLLKRAITNWRYSRWPTCFGRTNDTSVGGSH